MAQKTKVFSITAVVLVLCLSHAPPSWAGKSLWELRGQTTGQTEESSQGETTQAEPQVTAVKAQPQTEEEAKATNPEIAAFIDSIQIPSQYGRIKEKFVGKGPRMFVLMQEIHNHPEVQKNNKEIMTVLLDQYHLPLILIEGHYGPLTAPTLRSQSKQWREQFAKEKLESGYYNAEEYLYLTREVPPVIIGVDDETIVKEQYDLAHYKFLMDNRPKSETIFKQFNNSIQSAKEKLYSPALKAFDGSAQEYAQDKISAEEFVTILTQALKDHGAAFSETSYPNIALILKGNEAEDQEEYEKSQEYTEKVDHSKLFAEIKGLEGEIRSKWYKDPKEQKLDRLAKALYYFEKLSKISLIPLEWEEYIQDLSPFIIAELANFLRENGIAVSVSAEEITFLDQYRKEGETFYQIAIDRERTMVENSLGTLKDKGNDKAIIKTGGFHTAGISQFLRANHISYLIIAPRVTQPDMPTPYQEILRESMDKLSKTIQGTAMTTSIAQRRAVTPSILQNEQANSKEDTKNEPRNEINDNHVRSIQFFGRFTSCKLGCSDNVFHGGTPSNGIATWS